MQFGISSIDITPPVGVMLMGYEPRPAETVDHPLRAEALACEGEGGGWVLVNADVCAFNRLLTDRVRGDVAQATGLPPEAVMLAATHTHSGPHVTDALWCERSEQESAYFQNLRARLVDVAVRAWRTRSPGRLLHAQTAAPDLGSNRRVQRDDGTWTNEWSDPDGRHTGYFDPAVELVGVQRDDGNIDGLLVNFGCHPVGFGSRSQAISGDYVSYLKDALEAEGGPGTVLFTVSGHANVDPRTGCQEDPRVVREMGERLARIIRQALPSLTPVDGETVAAVREPWEFQANWRIGGRVSIYFPHAASGSRVSTGVSALAAGSLALLGLPGETVSEYRRKLQQRSPFPRTLLISLANDFVGYLPTDEILRQGAYEAYLCPLNPIEEALTARADAALSRAHGQTA